MKLSDVVKHLQKLLPLYSDAFSDVFSVTSLTRVDNIATVVTSQPHGLSVGSMFVLDGAKLPNPIIELTQSHGLARLVTLSNHDITKNSPLQVNDSTHVEIYGANEAGYNGKFLIMKVPNSNVVEFSIDASVPATATGSPMLKENAVANFNGRQIVSSVIDANTFTFVLADVPVQTEATGDITVKTGIRVSGEYNLKHCISSYEAISKDKLWAFVVFDGCDVSKSRVNQNDAIASYSSGTDLRLDGVLGVNVYVFMPATSEYCWVDFVDECQALRKPILKVLHRAKFDNELTEDENRLVYVGDMPVDIDGVAFLIHNFKFQTVMKISNLDGVDPEYTRAMRTFIMNDIDDVNEDSTEYMITKGDLPDEKINTD